MAARPLGDHFSKLEQDLWAQSLLLPMLPMIPQHLAPYIHLHDGLNFIFVTTDGHRPDALSLNGNRIVQTPNLDRIGREGIQFRNSFVVNALCLPSHATSLTGLYSHSTGCVDNQNRQIPTQVPLFTDLLREAGYEALFGKAHIKGLGERNWDLLLRLCGGRDRLFLPCKTPCSRSRNLDSIIGPEASYVVRQPQGW